MESSRFGFLLFVFVPVFLNEQVSGVVNLTPSQPAAVSVVEGNPAKLVFNYTVDDRNAEFSTTSPTWNVYLNGTQTMLMFDNRFAAWNWAISNDCPARYRTRISREDVATLVIRNVTKEDTGNYSCEIPLNGGGVPPRSFIYLTVIDAPTSPPTTKTPNGTEPQPGPTSTPAPTGPDTTPAPSTGLGGGAIAGIVVGCLVFVAIVVGVIWWKKRPRGSSRGISDSTNAEETKNL